MSRIRGSNTKPEKVVRSLLRSLGYSYRLNRRDLPGTPDIVIPKLKTAIFVHGCFWHRHQGCKNATTPKSNTEFWKTKFGENVQRDSKKQESLRSVGWNVIVIWECETELPYLELAEILQRRIASDAAESIDDDLLLVAEKPCKYEDEDR